MVVMLMKIIAAALALSASASPAFASTTAIYLEDTTVVVPSQATVREAQDALERLGLPIGKNKSKVDDYTMRGICAWRELVAGKAHRKALSKEERNEIVATTQLAPAKKMVVGLNVNRECQTVAWVVENKQGERKLKAVYPVSTGKSGYTTPAGKYRINRETNAWHESTGYPGAMMYRPKYFNGGIAFHGSYSDSIVYPRPASHGCVRMLHKDIDKLWKAGMGVGTPVKVY